MKVMALISLIFVSIGRVEIAVADESPASKPRPGLISVYGAGTSRIASVPIESSIAQTGVRSVQSEPTRVQGFANAGLNLLLEKSSDGKSSEASSPYAFRVGARLLPARVSWAGDLSYEYSRILYDENGAATVTVSSARDLHLIWLRWLGYRKSIFTPTLGIAQGAFQDHVTTRFYGAEEKNHGRLEWLSAVAVGGLLQFASRLELNAELRVFSSQKTTPNNVLGANVSLGVHF